MRKKFNLPAKATIWFTFGNFIAKGIAFVSLPIFTRIMNASEYGIASLFLNYEQIVLIFGTFEMYLGTYQRGIFKFKEDKDAYSGFTVLLMNCITLMVFVVLFLNHNLLFRYTSISIAVLFAMLCRTFFQPAYECWLVRKRVAYDFKPAVITNVMLAGLNVIVPVIAMYYFNPTAETKIVSGLITTSVFAMIFWGIEIIKVRKVNVGYSHVFFEFNMHMALPNIPHALSFLVLANADRIMIGKMVGDTAVAYYSVAYTIGSTLMILQSSISSVFAPWMYRSIDDHNEEAISKISNKIAILLGTVAFLFILIIPDIFNILFTEEYRGAYKCIPPIAMSSLFMFAYSAFVHYELYNEKPKYIMIVSSFCAILNVILNYFFIPIAGYSVCCWTTLVSYIFFSLGHCIFAKRISTIKKAVFPFNVRTLAAIYLFYVILICISSQLYRLVILRYCIVAIILVLFFLFRKQIISNIVAIK